jgi:hypothetical protein
MPTGRNHLAAGAIEGKLYVAGGRPGNLNVLEVFDPQQNAWAVRAPMPTGRSGHAGAAVKNKLYVFGGEGNASSPIGIFSQAEVYDPASDSWEALDPMTTPRHGIGAAAAGSRIFIPGGATAEGGGSHTGVNEAFVVQSELLHFPHFASGNGLTSEAVLANLADAPSLTTVEFFDREGRPLETEVEGALRSLVSAELPPLGSLRLRSTKPGGEPEAGSAIVSAERPVGGTILFSSTLPGFRGLAGAGAARPTTRFLVPVQRDPFRQLDSGIAIANTTGQSISITLTLRNAAGAVLGVRTLDLPPRGQLAAFLQQLFPDADLATFSFEGTVEATSTGIMAALALLFTGTEFATLPVSEF